MAALNGVQDTVRLHICQGNNINAIDGKGRFLLMLAASRGHTGLCRLLLEAGADPDVLDQDGSNALAIANSKGYADIVSLLREDSAVRTPAPARLETQLPFVPISSANADEAVLVEEEYDLSVWEEDEDSPPSPADKVCLDAASTLQHDISAHVSIDTDEDWSDIEIDLPEVKRERRRKGALGQDGRATIYGLILDGLRDGSVPSWRLDEATLGNDGEPDEEFGTRLTLTLGELGVIIDEEPLEWRIPGLPDETDEESECMADEAVSFLDSRRERLLGTEPFNHLPIWSRRFQTIHWPRSKTIWRKTN